MKCRHCSTTLTHKFLDLGSAPPSNAYLSQEQLHAPELYFPLRLFVCDHCWLVQTEDFADADLFFSSDYAYFSSISKSWLAHAKDYCEMITEFLSLTSDSLVVEIASNDGYLLKNFVETNIPCLGIEPTLSTAEAAEQLGIPVIKDFFGGSLAKKLVAEGKKADLIAGNNVYAHVPDINDFTLGIKTLLKPEGVVTLEFPHLSKLLEFNQFDTVYHEHFSYLSLATVNQIFNESGLRIFKVEQLTTHGGSLRVFGCLHESKRIIDSSVINVIEAEKAQGLQSLDIYNAFQNKVDYIKNK
ncbi:MAG: class I SAM-dependent methyltransferase, partial [Colwellia sp.]